MAATDPPAFEEKPVPTWQRVTAVGYVLVVAVCIWAFRDRLSADFWPFDDARVAPNILATIIQIVAYTPLAVLVWPPTRRRIHTFVTRHTAPLHARMDELEKQAERHHKAHMAKLDAVHDHLKQSNPLP